MQEILKLYEDVYSSKTKINSSKAKPYGLEHETRTDQQGKMEWSKYSIKILGVNSYL